MPFPPNSTDRYQKRQARDFEEINRFRDTMENISQHNRQIYKKYAPSKDENYTPFNDYGAGEQTAQPAHPPRASSRRSGSFGRLVVYVVLGIIALAGYRQFQNPDQQGSAKTASIEAPGLALASETVSWLSPEMLTCEGSNYGCSVGNRFIGAHRYQVLKCVYGGTYYLFWKDNAPPGWDRFINGHAFDYLGKSVLAQCPTNSTEAARVF